MDIFEKIQPDKGPLAQYAKEADGYFAFPKLEGEIAPWMTFRGRKMLTWSLNNYLGLANHPEIRKVDAEASKEWGLAYPMGARMMSGQTKYHEKLEQDLADFVHKEASFLINYGYQGMVSIIDALVDRKDVIVYDSDAHACIMDGMRLHVGKRFVYQHNDMESLEKQLNHATKVTGETGGGILVITEGVYGMVGDLGNLKAITDFKDKYQFRLLVDDAHGFGTMGEDGSGTGTYMGVQDKVDLYFGTFAKSMASVGAFIATERPIIDFLRYTLRSQIYSKSLPMPITIGASKRLEMIKTHPEFIKNLWTIVNALQSGLREAGFDLGKTQSPVTPVMMHGTIYEASNMLMDLRESFGVFCSIVLYPVVPKGTVLFRFIPTAAHTLDDVKITIDAFKEMKKKQKAGYYEKERFMSENIPK
ncbi:MAG: aminotransferase class I/II-fold pyridoxal phosphate-dependent enzyme [Bacteroidales bacterium]|nr:aminotransferase class I/II-fold pyridoxal phosphate-dependent enzyme [Bacteroidales bacterium]